MKCKVAAVRNIDMAVTLRVRVWIEIQYAIDIEKARKVTLRVRVWIEITAAAKKSKSSARHPPCEGVD